MAQLTDSSARSLFIYVGANSIGDIGVSKIWEKQWPKLNELFLSEFMLSKKITNSAEWD